MSTTRATMKHAAVYSAAAMAGRIIGFIMLPFYAHILRQQGYGVIGMLDVGLGFLLSLLVYGMQGSIVRLYHDEKDPARKPLVVSTGIILIGTATAILTIPLIIFARPISAFLIDDANLSRLTIMALVSFNFDLMGQAATSWLLVRSRSSLLAAISILRLFIGLSLNIYLIVIRNMGLDGYFISGLVVNVVSCFIFVGIAIHDCGYRFDPTIARTIKSFLLPLMPGSLASWVGRQIERVLAKSLINLGSVGILEMGYKFPILISILVTKPFIRSWDTRRFEIADQPGAPQTIARMFTYYMFIVIWAGLVMAVAIEPVLVILTPPEFHLAYRIARIEVVTLVLQGAYYHMMFGLAYAKNTAMLSKIRGFTAAIKVALSWFLISHWGIHGAAFSAAIASLLSVVLVYHFSQKEYYLRLEWKALGTLVLSGVGVFLLLTNWDFTTSGAYQNLEGHFLPWLQHVFGQTFLGSWKNGKAITLLAERSAPTAELILKVGFSILFAVMLPIIHQPSRQKIWAFGRKLIR